MQLHKIKRSPRGGKRRRTEQAREAINKALQARDVLILELNQTESLKDYDFLVGLLREVEAVEAKAKTTLKDSLRNNK